MKGIAWPIRSLLLVLLLCGSAWGDDAPPAPQPAAHEQLQQILQQPIYNAWRNRQQAAAPTGKSMASWALDKLSDYADRFWNWLFPPRKPRTLNGGFSVKNALPKVLESLAWIAAAAAVIFIALLIIKSMRAVHLAPSTARILSRDQIQDALNSGDALALDAAQWLEQGQRLALEQNFRAAYRALYLALLSGLHRAGKIDHGRNRTNWSYVQHYRGPVDERRVFGDLTDLFDRVWYGRKPEGERDISQLQKTVSSLIGVGSGS